MMLFLRRTLVRFDPSSTKIPNLNFFLQLCVNVVKNLPLLGPPVGRQGLEGFQYIKYYRAKSRILQSNILSL